MQAPSELQLPPSTLRFHAQGQDDLFRPIAFGFVTERMCSGILAERDHILSFTPASRRSEQHRLFGQYDPRRRAEAFRALLRPFEAGESQAV